MGFFVVEIFLIRFNFLVGRVMFLKLILVFFGLNICVNFIFLNIILVLVLGVDLGNMILILKLVVCLIVSFYDLDFFYFLLECLV